MTGVPDNLDRLWAPDRLAYATGEVRPAGGYDAPSGCPFCLAPTRPPDQGLVVARGDTVFAVLNLFPYNPGHLMVCPYRHVAEFTDLEPDETLELAQFTQAAIRAVRRVSGPHGFNLGMNQGHAGGAGIAAHLHQHVVPRWAGDTNFMPVVGRTKVLPQLLTDTRTLLAKAWEDGDAGPAAGSDRDQPRAATGDQPRAATGGQPRTRAGSDRDQPRAATGGQPRTRAGSDRDQPRAATGDHPRARGGDQPRARAGGRKAKAPGGEPSARRSARADQPAKAAEATPRARAAKTSGRAATAKRVPRSSTKG